MEMEPAYGCKQIGSKRTGSDLIYREAPGFAKNDKVHVPIE